MKTIILKISYDGTDYYGFQKQTGNERTTPSIQGRIESVLTSVLGRYFETKGSGRTDKGVHAIAQVISVVIGDDYELKIPAEGIKSRMNNYLPRDIRVNEVRIVEGEFHARGMAKEKTYAYIINYGDYDVFSGRLGWHLRKKIDFTKMRQLISLLRGKIFCAPFCDGEIDTSALESYYKNIYYFNFYNAVRAKKIIFIIKAQGFLYKMVRRLIGFLTDYASGRLELKKVESIMKDYRMRSCYVTAPPEGLFLYKVKY